MFSEALEKAFRDSGWTAYRWSKESGVSQQVIGRWLSGERGITLETADRLAAVLPIECRLKK